VARYAPRSPRVRRGKSRPAFWRVGALRWIDAATEKSPDGSGLKPKEKFRPVGCWRAGKVTMRAFGAPEARNTIGVGDLLTPKAQRRPYAPDAPDGGHEAQCQRSLLLAGISTGVGCRSRRRRLTQCSRARPATQEVASISPVKLCWIAEGEGDSALLGHSRGRVGFLGMRGRLHPLVLGCPTSTIRSTGAIERRKLALWRKA
jgi:hypothetical protein